MTTKEIAKAIGRPLKTVQTWTKLTSAKMASISAKMAAGSSARPADYDLDETLAIIETGLGKNAADVFRMAARQNALQPRQNDEVITKSDLAEFGRSIVSETIKQLLPFIQGNAAQPVAVKQTLAIEAPQMDLRSQLRQIMNQAARESGDYPGVWNTLYTEIFYRLHFNVRERAKNAGVEKLDVLEAEGHLMNAILIAREIFRK